MTQMDFSNFKVPYQPDAAYSKRVAYFSMEFAIEQPLKIYSGGLGFLACSHMRSAYELKQNLIGIGILWKYGYYDQTRNQDQTLKPHWTEKTYNFLEDTGIRFQIAIHNTPVWVKAWYLHPETFQTAPMFLLSTDLPENDHISQTITHRLYNDNVSTKLAQCILLGIGGAKLIELLRFDPEVYHLNEAHASSSIFYLYNKFHHNLDEVRRRLVFTTHTPEEAGNEKHDIHLCERMSFFDGLPLDTVRTITGIHDDTFNHSLAVLRIARVANGVSQLHGKVSRDMWRAYPGITQIKAITNAQNAKYWSDEKLLALVKSGDSEAITERKKELKAKTFKLVADQTGKIFKPDVLTLVWARRFAEYKRPELITRDYEAFRSLLTNTELPVQIIWAGKPYPKDQGAIETFNHLVHLSKQFPNMAVCVDYELALSRRLKQGSDIWLNTPRVPREASGTSGMTAAMNGSVNLSTDDGWICEFKNPGINSFVVPNPGYAQMDRGQQDEYDRLQIMRILQEEVLPRYYHRQEEWLTIVKQGLDDVMAYFESGRMAREYYEQLYNE